MRRAHSEELLSEVGVDDISEAKRSPEHNRTNNEHSASGFLQVSDHPRMRHNSADNIDTTSNDNNYENFAHELTNSYIWSPMMTDTRELSNNQAAAEMKSRAGLVQVDLNSTNSDSISHRSSVIQDPGSASVSLPG